MMSGREKDMAVADMLRRFVLGETQDWEFDDFISSPSTGIIEIYRRELIDLPDVYPPREPGRYCDEGGVARILEIADTLENRDQASV